MSIDLGALERKGKVLASLEAGSLCFTPERAIPTTYHRESLWDTTAALVLPGAYTLPLRIDFDLRLDAPGFFLFVGKGRVHFASHWSDNRRLMDIAVPSLKPRLYPNHVPLDTWTRVSVLFARDVMAIWIGGEARYVSTKEKYMRDPALAAMNAEGFALQMATAKGTHARVRNIVVTEDPEPVMLKGQETPPMKEAANLPPGRDKTKRPTYEACIAQLPDDVRARVNDMDAFLRGLRPVKFRREIEKNGNKISYIASAHGFSYAVHPSGDYLCHTLQWYHVMQGKPETWHVKADHMIEVLERISEADPALADRLFGRLHDCVGCGPGCLARRPYAFKGRQAVACHGKLWLTQRPEDFADVRALIETLGALNGVAK